MAKVKPKVKAKVKPEPEPESKPTRIVMWDSECDKLMVDTDISFTKELIGGNLAVMVDCYELTGVHGKSSVIFVGPNALEVAEQWRKWFEATTPEDEDEDRTADPNGEPETALNEFAKWLAKQ